jgi:hypothetical protein
MLLAMLAVIVLSLAAGVGLGYVIIFGILYAFDRSRKTLRRIPKMPVPSRLCGQQSYSSLSPFFQ